MKCIRCGKEHDGSFGSGRFCSLHCAKARNVDKEQRSATMKRIWEKRTKDKRKEISDKISKSNTGKVKTPEMVAAMSKRQHDWYISLTNEQKETIRQHHLNKTAIHKNGIEKRVPNDELAKFISDGWQLGRTADTVKKFKDTFANKTKEETSKSYEKLLNTIMSTGKYENVEDYYKERIAKAKETYNLHEHPRHITKIMYDGLAFDSSWELKYYKWLKKNNIDFVFHPDIKFTYEIAGQEKFYKPDFKVGEDFIEIKGDHFFEDKNPSNKMICPWDRSKDAIYEAKHQCMIRNNVKILTGENIKHLEE